MQMIRRMAILLVVLMSFVLVGCSSYGEPLRTGTTSVSTQAGTTTKVTFTTTARTTAATKSAMEITPEMQRTFLNGEVDVEDITLPPRTITISAVGDIMAHKDTFDAARTGGTYDFAYMMEGVEPCVRDSDFVLGNLETTLSGADKGYTGYPDFNTPEQIADALRSVLGIDLVSTANNHSLDRGYPGLCTTLDNLDARGIRHVGTYRSEEASLEPLIVTIQDIKVGFINYTYGLNNPGGVKYKWSVNVTDQEAIRDMAQRTKDAGAEYIIALLHWGIEYERTPTSAQRELATWIFANTDVRLIIGTHPHVVQPIEEITVQRNGQTKTGVVLYSLGNFTGSQLKAYTDTGMLATIKLLIAPGMENSSCVESIDCSMLYIDPNFNQEKGYRVVTMEKAMRDYEQGADYLISARDYEKMSGYMEAYREQLAVLPYVYVH